MAESQTDPLRRVSRIAGAFLLVAACLGVITVLAVMGASYFRHKRNVEAERAVAPVEVAPELRLADFVSVKGTAIFRARLVDERASEETRSSYKSHPFRNVLFANSETGASTWLLKDNDHDIVKFDDLPDEWRSDKPPPLVTVALVKPKSEQSSLVSGDLLLMTVSGERIVKIAEGVRTLAATSIVKDTTIAIVYERDRRFFMAQYALDTLARVSEREIVISSAK